MTTSHGKVIKLGGGWLGVKWSHVGVWLLVVGVASVWGYALYRMMRWVVR